LRQLSKKYRNISADVQSLINRLEAGEKPGEQVQHVGHVVYKVRLKSGGYRVIYYVRLSDHVVLITIYAKAEKSDINPQVIKRIIDQYQPPDG